MKSYQEQTYYELLEVPASASLEEIHSAYERLKTLYSADSVALYGIVDTGDMDTLRARLLEAMEILTDSDLRQEYDRTLGLERREESDSGSTQGQRVQGHGDDEAKVAEPAAVHSTHPGVAVEYVAPARAEEPAAASMQDAHASQGGNGAAAATPGLLGEDGTHLPEREAVIARTKPPRNSETAVARPLSSPETSELAPRPSPIRESGRMAPLAEPLPSRGSGGADSARSRRLEQAAEMAHESAIGLAETALAQVAVKVRDRQAGLAPAEPRSKPIDIPADAEFNGELLRQVRKSRGYSLSQLADRTRIGLRHLENVEADRYDQLPATVYLRGILMNLARELGLDPLRVSKSYLGLAAKK